ncbi:hypothetical protein [Fusobacterium periodonticum]|uniref:Uncharacterized protein n=1 Tax=Fusobacterium periodonticum ATCC 33693 TaxID=546275 RepID=D4CX56_9FUSO|nr:hypothetical protein [Fusobacterium periodonticum]EFE85976.1 hypothetical protein FUSPEROL_02016 [Fusobacterium periodonticum ATCC 33693]
MKKFLLMLFIFVSVVCFGVTEEEVRNIKLKHSDYTNVEVKVDGKNVIIFLKLNVKASESNQVGKFVIEDTKTIFSYFKKKYSPKDYWVVDINFFIQNMKVANTNATSETIEKMNIKNLNFNNAKSKLDAWDYNWD